MQNADNLEHCNSGLMHTFSQPNASIHGVCSVLTFHAVFAFQKCLLGCAELRGKHVFRKNEIIHVWHIESSVAQTRNLVDFSYSKPQVDNAFKCVLSKIQYRQATGYWNFTNLKLGLEVFLNFFPCVYFLGGCKGFVK